jgi:hypothetical protein
LVQLQGFCGFFSLQENKQIIPQYSPHTQPVISHSTLQPMQLIKHCYINKNKHKEI